MDTLEQSVRTPAGTLPVTTLYLSGMLQGLTLVSFPASSVLLKQMHGFTDAQYGAIFLPQVAAAVVGALAGGALAGRLGLRSLLAVALAINALSQVLLASTLMLTPAAALVVVMLGTASMGLAFGLSGAPLNGLPPLLFPRRRDTAIVALHTMLGAGLAIGPILANSFIRAGHWVGFPLSLTLLALVLALLALCSRYPTVAHEAMSAAVPAVDPMPLPGSMMNGRGGHPVRVVQFWIFVVITVLYAFAEGTFGNWAILYLQDVKHLPESVAAAALSVFWAAMVAGRLLTSVLVLRVPPRRIWLSLPMLMVAAFLLLPYAATPVSGIAYFALAGLACSAFFPLTIGIASARFADQVPWVSSMLIAALMVGVGLGSWLVGLLRELLAMERLYQLSVCYPALVLLLAYGIVRPLRSGSGVGLASPR